MRGRGAGSGRGARAPCGLTRTRGGPGGASVKGGGLVLALALVGAVLPALAPASLEAQGRRGGGGGGEGPLPLEEARSAEISVTRGSWISLDVSPDGETIVFDLLGDLYTLPIEGGAATRITEGLAFDAQPRFSPDGKSVVFVSDRSGGDNVWTMRLDFSDTTQVTRGNTNLYFSPAWLPGGEEIVVARAGGLGGAAKLHLLHVEGGPAPLPLVRQPSSLKTLGPAPDPEGRYVWFAARRGDWQYNALFPQYQLHRYDRETGRSEQMTDRYGSAFRPALSPDGRWLAYGSRHEAETGLRIRELATGEERWLAYPIQRDEAESRATLDVLPGYAFTPDSEAVVISYGGEIWRVPVDGSAPTRIPFEVEEEVALGPQVSFRYRVDTGEEVVARQIRSAVPSPDGERVAFTAFDRLWMANADGEGGRRLTDREEGEFHPVWSPDGTWIAYVTWRDDDGGHVMRVRSDGSEPPERLTENAALYYNPAWSPDGERIVASRGAARELKKAPDVFFGPLGGEFVWVPAGGGEVTSIAPLGGRDVAHFRADEPDRIYAHSPSQGLVSFRWDGTDLQEHLQVRGAPPRGGASPHPEEMEFLPRRPFPVSTRGSAPGGGEGTAETEAESGVHAAEQRSPPPPAGLILAAPRGDRALAQVGRHLYTVEIPRVGGDTPTISVANPAGAPVPVRQLTEVGGEFPAWSGDGERVHWSLGNALVTYDVARVRAIEDSVAAEGREAVRRALRAKELLDSLAAVRSRVDSLEARDTQVPDSLREELNRLVGDSVEIRADSLLREAEEARRRAEALRAHADSVRAGLDTARADPVRYRPDERRVEVTLARDVPRGTVVLRGGRVLTMVGREVIEDADVVVTDDRIVAVGPRGEVEVPEAATVIDVSGKTVTPGFVDTHYHAQWLVPEIHPEQTWQYLTNLAYGVTTTRDPQSSTTDILSYRDRVETGGMLGPRIFSTGPGVFLGENIEDREHALRVLKRYAEYWDTKTLKMYMTGNRQQRQWIISAARELELMPTTEGGLDIKQDLTHALDGYPGIEHNLPVAPLYEDVAQLLTEAGTTNSPTLLVSYGGPFGENYFYTREDVQGNEKLARFTPGESLDRRTRRRGPGAGGSPGQAGWFADEEHVFPRHAAFVERLVAEGGRAGVGSHGQLQGLGYHWELWAMASGGLPNHDALRVATVFGAEAIGLGEDLGTVEGGKLADLLVFDADPLEELRNTVQLGYVMKNGRLYEAETLDEVWPRERPLPVPPWRGLGPEEVRAGVR